jgi:hypothetical protein
LQFNITARQAGTIQYNIKGYATIQPLQFNITARQAGTIQNIKGYATIQPLQFNIFSLLLHKTLHNPILL